MAQVGEQGKTYGLIIKKPLQNKPKVIQKPSIFQEDDETQETVAERLRREAVHKKEMKKVSIIYYSHF